MNCNMLYLKYKHLSSSSAIQNQVRPLLEKLKADSDMDVQFFAVEALEGEHLSKCKYQMHF